MTAPGYRPEFLAALDLLARASALMVADGAPPPILVGGAVVECDTLSAVTSGDLDLVSPAPEALGRALLAVGFRREDRPRRRLGGWYHADLPIAVDVRVRAILRRPRGPQPAACRRAARRRSADGPD